MSKGQEGWGREQAEGRGRPVPGLGSISSSWGILGQGWGCRGCSTSWWGSPITPGDSHLLGLRSVFPTVGTEDHPIELGHTGLVEAVGHTEIWVAF